MQCEMDNVWLKHLTFKKRFVGEDAMMTWTGLSLLEFHAVDGDAARVVEVM